MFEEVVSMLKKVVLFDLLIGIFAATLIQVFYNAYAMVFLLGLAMATLTFTVSGVTLSNYLSSLSLKHGAIMTLANFAKILVICIIGVLIFNNNISNVISYIMGFTSHFLALMLYGIIYLLGERK